MHRSEFMRARELFIVVSLFLSGAAPTGAGPGEPLSGELGRAEEDSLVWLNPIPTGSTLNAVAWREGESRALIAGQGGTALLLSVAQPPSFSALSTGTDEDLHAIAAHPSRPMYLLAGASGTLLLFDGSSFASLETGTSVALRAAAWSPDGSFAVIVGDRGTLLVYDTISVRRVESGTGADLRAVAWGRDFALITGAGGFACKFNGSTCAPLSTGVTQSLNAVAFRPDGSYAVVAGGGGAVLGFDGSGFSVLGTAPQKTFYTAAWKRDGTAALIAGLDGATYGASAYLLDSSGLHALECNLTFALRGVVWEPGVDIALLVGSRGLVAEYTGVEFVEIPSTMRSDFSDAAWRPDGSCALIVGSSGRVLRLDGSGLRQLQSPVSAELAAVAWHPGGGYALICGRDGTVLRYNHSSSVIELLETGLGLTVNYTGVSWKPDGSYALLVGDFGKLVAYDGRDFVLKQVGGVNYLDVAWKPDGAYALIGGVSGTLARYEERHLPPPLDFCVTKLTGAGTPATAFFSISWRGGPSPEAMVAGTQGVVARVNDTAVQQLPSDTTDTLYSIDWMPGSGYALAGGVYGKLLLFVSYGFIHPRSGTDISFLDVSFAPDGSHALLVGQSGAVARYTIARRTVPKAVISSPKAHSVFEPGASVYFDGANSTPSFGETLRFEWVSNISGAVGSGPRLRAVLQPGRHLVTLFANDTKGRSGSASVPITVLAPNRAPVPIIDSPADGSLHNDTDEILFDGSRSHDPDGDPLMFYWVSSRDGFLGAEPAFYARLSVGEHRVTLWLSDGPDYNVSATVNITIVPFNRPPVARITQPQNGSTFTTRESVRFDASSSYDEDGDELSFYWVSSLSGHLSSSARFSRSLAEGSHRITVWVDDSRGGNASASVEITVVRANEPPGVSIDFPAEGSVLRGEVEFSGTARDPEGAAVSVQVRLDEGEWQEASVAQGSTAAGVVWSHTVSTRALRNGPHILEARASDGEVFSETASLNFTVHNPEWGFSVSVDFPLNATTVRGRITIAGTASRLGSSIQLVELRIDDGPWRPATGTASWEYIWDTTSLKNGWHRITVRAFDGTDHSPELTLFLKVENPGAEPGRGELTTAVVVGIVAAGLAAGGFVALRSRRKEEKIGERWTTRGEEE
ncbi:MAG: Ig-like domain-containing protein [Thermoplasmata archaeon]